MLDPVIRAIGAAEAEHEAREHIAQGALQRQAEDDGDRARCGEQASDRKIEYIGDDGEGGGEIDDAGDDVLEELRLARPPLEIEEAAQEADQEPGAPGPPGDLQPALTTPRNAELAGRSGS